MLVLIIGLEGVDFVRLCQYFLKMEAKLLQGKGMDVLNIDQELIKAAKPEGELRDLCMLLGVVGSQTCGHVWAYEKLPGVGLGVIEFKDLGHNEQEEELLKHYRRNGMIH